MKEEEGRRKQVEQREDEVSAITYLDAPVCIYIYTGCPGTLWRT